MEPNSQLAAAPSHSLPPKKHPNDFGETEQLFCRAQRLSGERLTRMWPLGPSALASFWVEGFPSLESSNDLGDRGCLLQTKQSMSDPTPNPPIPLSLSPVKGLLKIGWGGNSLNQLICPLTCCFNGEGTQTGNSETGHPGTCHLSRALATKTEDLP